MRSKSRFPGRSDPAGRWGIYNITERLGQMLGPVALGQVIALWGVNSGLLGMAAVLAVLNILFALTGRLAKAGA